MQFYVSGWCGPIILAVTPKGGTVVLSELKSFIDLHSVLPNFLKTVLIKNQIK